MSLSYMHRSSFWEKDIFWNSYKFIDIFGHCRKSFPTVYENFLAGLSQLQFSFSEDLSTESCFIWEILYFFSFFRILGESFISMKVFRIELTFSIFLAIFKCEISWLHFIFPEENFEERCFLKNNKSSLTYTNRSSFWEKDVFWKSYSFINIFGLCTKSCPTVGENFLAGLPQIHSNFLEEFFTETCLMRKFL